MDIAKIKRPSRDLVERVREVGAATASATLAHMGIRNCFMEGPVARSPGQVVAGPCVTLQMMPKREDLFDEGEYADVEKQLHRHVLYQVEEGDIVVVDARGDMTSAHTFAANSEPSHPVLSNFPVMKTRSSGRRNSLWGHASLAPHGIGNKTNVAKVRGVSCLRR